MKDDYPYDKTVHELFAAQVAKTPDSIAVIGPVRTVSPVPPVFLTYRQLNEQTDSLAGILIERGVRENSIAAILMENTIEMIIAILAVLKVGAASKPVQ